MGDPKGIERRPVTIYYITFTTLPNNRIGDFAAISVIQLMSMLWLLKHLHFYDTKAPCGSGPPHHRDFTITHATLGRASLDE
jgi:hypothetical protein